ncbi:TPA: minichromosome maintenance protein MCM [Candidatus Woesearchaeota archaeon]|nr:minichromosome maintenance protein MCM [Candidatus Woesearchaeota archaeon]HII68923.1 minichromosome maintenance protein MCM [Candidatus Woesearchaeota archaeon]
MDAVEQIQKFTEFFDSGYKEALLRCVREDKQHIAVDFSNISRFDPDLGDILLEQPEEVLKAAELAIEQIDLGRDAGRIRVRLENIPESQHLMIKDIRAKHLGKLHFIEGVVRQKSDVRPQVTAAKFECPACGHIINVLQVDTQFKTPSKCPGCGHKGKFRIAEKDLVDAQGLVLEEVPESLEGGEQPKRMRILLMEDLVSPLTERKTNPGSKIGIVGILKEVPVLLRTGAISTRYDLIIEGNNVKPLESSHAELLISEEEEEQIKEIASDPHCVSRLVESLVPSIYGYEIIKEALLIQLLGGVRKVRKDAVVSRGDIHILLIGDPGAGKSAMLKRIHYVAPKSRYVSGKGASGAGLTASVVKDEFLRGWSLEAGAMVLASDGVCVIDELDKMSRDDTSAMHEAMENQTVSIAKANIQATLVARATVLGAANPKYGRFDPYGIVADQIDLPPTLINRFDLIFAIKDIPDEIKDKKIASHILSLHKDPDSIEPEIPTELLRKYVSYAKRIEPRMTDEAMNEILEYYMKMRASGSGDGGVRAIPISARQLEALVRMSEAAARMRLQEVVTKREARRAIDLLEYCLLQVGLDKETGKIDIDRIATGISASQRSTITIVRQIVVEMEGKEGKSIPIDDIIAEAKGKGLTEEKVEESINKLKIGGEIFEPRRGFIQRIP